jgi:hypothetical protein
MLHAFAELLYRALLRLGNRLEAKGRNPKGYQIVLTALCIGAAIAALLAGLWLGVGIMHSGHLGGLFVICGMIVFPAIIALVFNFFVDRLPSLDQAEPTREDETAIRGRSDDSERF